MSPASRCKRVCSEAPFRSAGEGVRDAGARALRGEGECPSGEEDLLGLRVAIGAAVGSKSRAFREENEVQSGAEGGRGDAGARAVWHPQAWIYISL